MVVRVLQIGISTLLLATIRLNSSLCRHLDLMILSDSGDFFPSYKEEKLKPAFVEARLGLSDSLSIES